MANPYLIQALYAPKPAVRCADDAEAGIPNSPASRPLSLVEKLYGRQSTPNVEQDDLIHPARRTKEPLDGELIGGSANAFSPH